MKIDTNGLIILPSVGRLLALSGEQIYKLFNAFKSLDCFQVY